MTAGCALQADSDAAQDNSASTAQLVEMVEQHSLANFQQELPDLLGQIISGTRFVFSEESGRGLAKWTASSCLSTSITLCGLDALIPWFEFSNGVCDDPETRCAQGGPTWADLKRRKPDLTQVLEEAKSFMTNQIIWAPIFAELRARGHEEWVEHIEPWTRDSAAAFRPPLAAGGLQTFDAYSVASLAKLLLGVGAAFAAVLMLYLTYRSAVDVTTQVFVPNIVATSAAGEEADTLGALAEKTAAVDEAIRAHQGLVDALEQEATDAINAYEDGEKTPADMEALAARLEDIAKAIDLSGQALLQQGRAVDAHRRALAEAGVTGPELDAAEAAFFKAADHSFADGRILEQLDGWINDLRGIPFDPP
ncbi:MAG: hypothetical protein H6714_00685 [Myxococcales bacterium]|nr:hypothetical protein [Myxococcales bacterium]